MQNNTQNNMNMKFRNIPFSPPDMTEAEAKEVREAILSGWITTGPRTKKLEQEISEYVHTDKTVCLNSATAAMEMVLHLLGVGPGDEVIVMAFCSYLFVPQCGRRKSSEKER